MKHFSLTLALLSVGLVGCGNLENTLVKKPQAHEPPPVQRQDDEKPPEPKPSIAVYNKTVAVPSFSEEAKEISRLLDDEKFTAASELVDRAIDKTPSDPALHIMKARLTALTRDVVWDELTYEGSRLSDQYWKQVTAAVEFNEALWPYAAHLTLGAICHWADAHLSKGEGFVHQLTSESDGDGTYRYLNGNSGIVFRAYECAKSAPSAASEWASDFARLVDKAIDAKAFHSAVILANLQGDLESGAVPGKDQDRATEALLKIATTYDVASADRWTFVNAVDEYVGLYKDNVATWVNREPQNREALEKIKAALGEMSEAQKLFFNI